MAKKIKQTSIQEPTEAELELFQQLIQDIDEPTLDIFANEYFGLVQSEQTNISFAKFIIDKIVRPVQPGDTINYQDGNKIGFLYCLIRKDIEEKTYLLFAMVDDKTEQIIPEMVYLFQVVGKDEVGMDIIDICESSPESERILDIMEADEDVEMANIPSEKKEEEENQ